MALGSRTCSVRQLNEMQTDPPKERKQTLPCFFQLYPGPRSATPSLLHCSILSHKTQRERECDKDESDVAGSYVKTITLQLSVIDFPNQRCIHLLTNGYQQGADAGEFSIHTSGLAKERTMLWGRLGSPTLVTRTALIPISSTALTMKVELTALLVLFPSDLPGALTIMASGHSILPSPMHSSAMGKGRIGSTREVLRRRGEGSTADLTQFVAESGSAWAVIPFPPPPHDIQPNTPCLFQAMRRKDFR